MKARLPFREPLAELQNLYFSEEESSIAAIFQLKLIIPHNHIHISTQKLTDKQCKYKHEGNNANKKENKPWQRNTGVQDSDTQDGMGTIVSYRIDVT